MVKTFITKDGTTVENQIQASEVEQFTLNNVYESSEILVRFKRHGETTVLNFVRANHTCKFFRMDDEGQITKVSTADKLATLRTFEEHVLEHVEGCLDVMLSIEFTK